MGEVRPPLAPVGAAVEARVVNLAGCAVGSVALAALAFVPGAFGSGRALWILGFVPAYAVLLVVLLRRRERPWVTVFLCLYAVLHTTVLSLTAATPAVQIIFLLALFVIPVSAALSLPARSVHVVSGLSALSMAAVTFGLAGPLGMRILAGLSAASLAPAPALAVLELRSRLETAFRASERLSRRDPLTGLLNRRGLTAASGPLLTAALRESTLVAVLVADLDHFKRINDEHGHAAGDEVLRRVAEAVRASVREADLVARTGGEEFCVLARLRRPDDVHRLAERLRLAVAGAASDWPVTISVGGVEVRPEDVSAADVGSGDWIWSLAARADHLLYEAKNAGRNASRVLVA